MDRSILYIYASVLSSDGTIPNNHPGSAYMGKEQRSCEDPMRKYGHTIDNGYIANQIHGFTIDYGKFILIVYMNKIDLPIPPILLICVIVSKRWIE